jgi:hypothetical protein
MSKPYNKGKGKTIDFLRALLVDAPAECVKWPFCTDGSNGYGRIGHLGKSYWAHRLMCILVHGDPPGPSYDAAHSCGNGHKGCVNPRHLSWATRGRNQLDRRSHGTKSIGGWKGHPKLTPAHVLHIRTMKGRQTQVSLAAQFGVTDATIRDVQSGKSWRHLLSN